MTSTGGVITLSFPRSGEARANLGLAAISRQTPLLVQETRDPKKSPNMTASVIASPHPTPHTAIARRVLV